MNEPLEIVAPDPNRDGLRCFLPLPHAVRDEDDLVGGAHRLGGAGDDRDARRLHGRPRGGLVPHQLDRGRGRPDPDQPRFLHPVEQLADPSARHPECLHEVVRALRAVQLEVTEHEQRSVADQFAGGRIGASVQTLSNGASNTQLSWFHQQDFSIHSHLTANVNFATSTSVLRQTALAPMAARTARRSSTNWSTARPNRAANSSRSIRGRRAARTARSTSRACSTSTPGTSRTRSYRPGSRQNR